MKKKRRKKKKNLNTSNNVSGANQNPFQGIGIGNIVGMALGAALGGWIGDKLDKKTKQGFLSVGDLGFSSGKPPKGVYQKGVKLPDHYSDDYELAMMSESEFQILEAARLLATEDIGPFARITLYPEVVDRKSQKEIKEKEIEKIRNPNTTVTYSDAVSNAENKPLRYKYPTPNPVAPKDHALIVHKDAIGVALIALSEKGFIS